MKKICLLITIVASIVSLSNEIEIGGQIYGGGLPLKETSIAGFGAEVNVTKNVYQNEKLNVKIGGGVDAGFIEYKTKKSSIEEIKINPKMFEKVEESQKEQIEKGAKVLIDALNQIIKKNQFKVTENDFDSLLISDKEALKKLFGVSEGVVTKLNFSKLTEEELKHLKIEYKVWSKRFEKLKEIQEIDVLDKLKFNEKKDIDLSEISKYLKTEKYLVPYTAAKGIVEVDYKINEDLKLNGGVNLEHVPINWTQIFKICIL